MKKELTAAESDRLARRVYIAFCCLSALFVALVVLVGALLAS